MEAIETKYVDENPAINIKTTNEKKQKHTDKTNAKITKSMDTAYLNAKITNPIKEVKKTEINYDFVVKSLKENIGVEIDDFFKINIGQKITKYNTDSFTRMAIIALEKSKQEIINEFKKILTNEDF